MKGKVRHAYLTPYSVPGIRRSRRLTIPADRRLLGAINGALTELLFPRNWEQTDGSMTEEETVDAVMDIIQSYLESDGAMIGTIFPFATEDVPNGALECDGSTHSRVDYPELYDVLDSAFIDDDDGFTLPDLRARFVVGSWYGDDDYTVGTVGGSETHALTVNELPAHTHGYESHTHTTTVPGGELPVPAAGPPVPQVGLQTGSTGTGQAHENRPPYVALRFGIWYV